MNSSQKTILIVEDSKTQALKLEYLLFKNGYKPVTAQNGEEALIIGRRERPDLIISDIIMPKMNGYEFCHQLKGHQSTQNIPVILLSALSETRDILKGLECGAGNFVTKPYSDDELLEQIESMLINQELRKSPENSGGISIQYEGEEFEINSSREQILDILVTTYQTAVNKNNELKQVEQKLKNLNLQLEDKIREKTEDLSNEIKEREQAEEELYRLSSVVHQAKSTIVITDLEGNIEYVNPRFTEVTGYSLSEVIGKNPRILKSGDHPESFYKQIWENVLAGREWKGEFCNRKKNGEVFYESASIFDIRDSDGTVRNLAKISEDITIRKEAQSKLNRLYTSLLDDIELASSVQSYLLPEWLVHEKNISVTSVYTPSEKVGGDIFDVIPLSDTQYVVYVGDISGHGVQAALIMTAVKSTINMLVNLEREDVKPYFIINKLNEILSKDFFQSNYLTIIFCLVDLQQDEIRYLNAGHPALIEYNKLKNETVIIDENSAIPVGWLDSYQYLAEDETKIDLHPDSIYFLYTDGLFECLNSEGLELGVNGFTAFLNEFKNSMDSIILPFILKQKLIDEDYDLKGDDFTLLTLQKHNQQQKKDVLLLRYSSKTKGKVAVQLKEFLQKRYSDERSYLRINSIIASHIHSIYDSQIEAKLKNPVLMELKKNDSTLRITFWEKSENNAHRRKKFSLSSEKFPNYIQDCDFNKYEVIRNCYDEIVESVIEISDQN